MARIFISHRRADHPVATRQLRDALMRRFGASAIFFDEASILPGAAFPVSIEQALVTCEVFVAVVGPQWTTGGADRAGLADPNDWIRREIAAVLARNDGREPAPALILPVLVGGASLPEAASLPGDLGRFTTYQAIPFPSPEGLSRLCETIERHLGEPATGRFGFRVLAARPAARTLTRYRLRVPTKPADLGEFVRLSDAEADIVLANPELTGPSRLDLYHRWCNATCEREDREWHATGNRTSAFLLLERQRDDGGWATIGVSIILPLTRDGGAYLSGFDAAEQDGPGRRRNAAALEDNMLSRVRSSCLLIDTWIIARAMPDARGRESHELWGTYFVLRHLAEFWTANRRSPMRIMVEPDNKKIGEMLVGMGFGKRDRGPNAEELFFIDFPLNEGVYSDEVLLRYRSLLQAIRSSKAKVTIVDDRGPSTHRS